MKKIGIKIGVVLAYSQMMGINALANALPINGKTTGTLSDQYGNLFTPQGFTFAIWGLIYTLLFVFVLGILIRPITQLSQKVSYWFITNALLNSSWILAWHYEQVFLSLVIMLGLLYSLIQLQLLQKNSHRWQEQIWLRLPFTIYFAWITIATIANITALFVSLGWDGYSASASVWTVTILASGIAIALSQVAYFRQWPFAAVVIWAYWGIYSKHTSPQGFDLQYPAIALTATIGMTIMFGSILWLVVDGWIKVKNK